ncbi:hypothetical protein CAPTEDRAFT_185673 [Capitella teleta]|uniref:Uncharacterized protein n=1 Tax=Capitella teleta TaxID=283909 RepID=R7V7E0_CAPTE|nr:hypothetical protein CAPTEDRAFT_185673 [Capitella teleta]|eukprot:ELU12291.1 hypothetical protein CAPTEDRAFT_185673 [Capitella teleta]
MFNRYKRGDGIRGERQRVNISNIPTTINENEILLILRIKFPNLGENDLIIPGTSRLAFNLILSGTDENRTIVQNIGRALISRIGIRIAGNEIFTLDNSDVFHCYSDCWLPKNECANLQYRGIDTSEGANVTKIRLNAGDKDETKVSDKNVAKAFSNRFYIPLDFEILDTDYPYHQHAFRDVLEYELTIIKSLKGILLLFKETETDFAKDSEKFYNPKIKKVDVTINGRTNQLFSSGLLPHHQMEEARKMFAGGVRKNPLCNDVNKQLHNSDITMDKFYNDRFCLWFDFRAYDKDHHHNTGRELRNTVDGISLQLTKEVETAGKLICYIFVVSHGEIEMRDNKYNANVY